MSFELIDSNTQLASRAAGWRNQGLVAVDTEFMRTRTFFPIPALYQVAAGDQVSLIDPLQVDQWQAFAGVLNDPDVLVLMHSCSEDLEVFASHLGVQPRGVFDTQLAAAFVAPRFSISYSDLVAQYLDVRLDKQETRSDWLQRPLSPAQLHYAADDVRYLEPLYQALRQALERLGRWDWFWGEALALSEPRILVPEEYYLGLRRAAQFGPRQLGRLQLLCAWRERRIRELDVPRARLVPDDALLEIAQADSQGKQSLYDLLQRYQVRRSLRPVVDELLAVLAQAERLPASMLPDPLPAPLTQGEAKIVKQLRQHGVTQAEQLGMAPELLVRRKDLEACLRTYLQSGQLHAAFLGWRYPIVGAFFEQTLADYIQRRSQNSQDSL